MNDTLIAERINAHLASGGVVQVTTYGKSWLYTAKHEGWFEMRDGEQLMVSVRLGRVVAV